MFTNRSHFGSRLGSLQAQLAGHARLGSSSHTDIYIYIYIFVYMGDDTKEAVQAPTSQEFLDVKQSQRVTPNSQTK